MNKAALEALKKAARQDFEFPNSIALAFDRTGKILFCDCANLNENAVQFPDQAALTLLNENLSEGFTDGSLTFNSDEGQYFGVYKFQEDWDCFFVRAELRSDTMKMNILLFGVISIVIIGIVVGFLFAGIFMFNRILENVHKITADLYRMQETQKLSLIDLSESPNDDVTYLAASFNSLSSTINNLLGIFQKFESKYVVAKAYNEHQIRL